MKIRPVEPSCFLHRERETDWHDRAKSPFSQFWKRA